MDDEYDLEAQLFGDTEEMHTETDNNAVPSDEQILNDVMKKDQPKRRKRSTVEQPKLREIELCSEKGFLELKRMFDNYSPKSKNPYDDLLIMMNKIEHWGHLLYPKSRFEDFVARVESLSEKKIIKTIMTKMRLDMPLTDEDFVANKENKEILRVNDNEGEQQISDMPPDDADLFEFLADMQAEHIPSTSQVSATSSSGYIAPKLSQEQLQRIEENKRRAQQLRAEREKRVKQLQDAVSVTTETSIVNQTDKHTSPRSESIPQNEHSTDDVMMDDNEALDLIFSSS